MFDHEKTISSFKSINYLGSKLRVLDLIENVINSVDPSYSRVYDLFSGSGIVSRKLSLSRPVTAIDIQEYSRVITNALLNPQQSLSVRESYLNNVFSSDYSKKVLWAIEPIVTQEIKSLEKARLDDITGVVDILENGSIILYDKYSLQVKHSEIQSAIKNYLRRCQKVNLHPIKNLMTTYYSGGMYFSYLQSAYIDISRWFINELGIEFKDTFLAALLSTASEMVNTVGNQFAQPLKIMTSTGQAKHNLTKKIQQDRNKNFSDLFKNWINKYMELIETNHENSVLRMDYLSAIRNITDDTKIVYADPPYTRDHYSRFYHTLETICLWDAPEVSMVKVKDELKPSRGIYRVDRHQSPFCIKSLAPQAFENLFFEINQKNLSLVLSYSPYSQTKNSRPRLLTISQLLDLAKRYFYKVEVVSLGKLKHNKLNSTTKHLTASDNAELVIVCEKPK